MLQLSLSALVIALIAAVLGFGGIANVATDIAVILFYVFGLIFLISMVAALIDSGTRSITK